jgi:hypothetical protein
MTCRAECLQQDLFGARTVEEARRIYDSFVDVLQHEHELANAALARRLFQLHHQAPADDALASLPPNWEPVGAAASRVVAAAKDGGGR